MECIFSRWSPGIGDPSIGGWLTVFVYGLAAFIAFMRLQVAISERERNRAINRDLSIWSGPEVRFWLALALGLVLLGINKQLDLQSFLTATGKCAAQAQGWYDNRRTVQIIFLTGLGIAGSMLAFFGFSMLRGNFRKNSLVLAGMALLLTFVMARAALFHQVDVLINWRILGLKINWILEIGALAMIIIGALRSRKQELLIRDQ